MGTVVQAGQRFAAIADMQVGDMNQQAAVGTTVALLERGSRVMSAIHKRIYVGLKQEFKLLAEVFKTYLPPVYPYDVPGARREIKIQQARDELAALQEKTKQEYIDSGTQAEVQALQKEIDSGKYSGGSAFAQANQAAVGGGNTATNAQGPVSYTHLTLPTIYSV